MKKLKSLVLGIVSSLGKIRSGSSLPRYLGI
jgi:hypothetical protein